MERMFSKGVCRLSLVSLYLMIGTALLSTAAIAQKSNGNPVAKTGGDAAKQKEVKFEVISIHPVKPGTSPYGPSTYPVGNLNPTPDGYSTRLTIGNMIMLAYGSSNSQLWKSVPLVNWPSWIGGGGDWYDVNARVSNGDRDAWRNQSNKHELLRTAMQDLLRDRCKLVIHEKPTQVEAFNLIVQKRGATLKPTPVGSALPKGGGPLPSGGVRVPELLPGPGHPMRWHYYGATMADLVEFLTATSSGRPVVDATGLTGRYDFTLQNIDQPARNGDDEEIYNWPVDPLGLVLKPGKALGFALVIDHIEKPTPN